MKPRIELLGFSVLSFSFRWLGLSFGFGSLSFESASFDAVTFNSVTFSSFSFSSSAFRSCSFDAGVLIKWVALEGDEDGVVFKEVSDGRADLTCAIPDTCRSPAGVEMTWAFARTALTASPVPD
jgi:hypothetical protein